MLPRPPSSRGANGDEPPSRSAKSVASAALRAGERAPQFLLPSATGERVSLAHALEQGPVVLAFAGPEPITAQQLDAIVEHCARVAACGGGFLAVAPRWPQAATALTSVTLLFDERSDVAAAYGLQASTLPTDARAWLPTAATFVISASGRIILSLKHKNLVDDVATANAICSLQALARRPASSR